MEGKQVRGRQSGKLRIGDDWNAITIIALSQQSPLKAVAELVENSIDARAANIVITRGKERGQHYLRIADDGTGIPRDNAGLPDFHYVATHICDSLKRRLKREDRQGIQGEFGIGLLSFWTLGEELVLTSAGADGKTYEMRMGKGDPRYTITKRRRLLEPVGARLMSAIEEQKRAAEEQASKEILRSIHRAFREALLTLPAEEYDWFQIPDGKHDARSARRNPGIPLSDQGSGQDEESAGSESDVAPQREFFDFPGPLYSVVISPASCTVPVGESKNLRAVPRDRARRLVEEDLLFAWEIVDGGVELANKNSEIVRFRSRQEPGLTRLHVQVRQREAAYEAEALITVTDALLPEAPKSPRGGKGLPFYTFERAPGQLWRSRSEAPLYLPPLYQGARVQQLSRALCGSAS